MDPISKRKKVEMDVEPENTTSNVSCKSCGRYWHVLCTAPRTKPRDSSSWKCASCNAKNAKDIKQENFREPSPTTTNDDIMKQSIKELQSEMKAVKESISTWAGVFKSVETNCSKREVMSGDIVAIQTRMLELEERNSVLEQSARVANLEFRGLTEYPEEDIAQIIIHAANLVGVNITQKDLKWIGRVGMKTNIRSKPRTVLAKFYDQELKNCLLRAIRKRRGIILQELGFGETWTMFVSENLTPHFRSIFYTAMSLRKFKYVWTYNCRIYARENRNSNFILIKSKTQLQSLI